MKIAIPALLLLLAAAIPSFCSAAPPLLVTPLTENSGANQATLVLQSAGSGTGYFTLQTGNVASCGTASQVVAGQSSTGITAPYHGSLPLTANTTGRYTVRNLTQQTTYTLCFTADSPTGVDLNPSPLMTNFTTTASSTLGTPQWVTRGTPGFTSGTATFSALAFAPDGTPYVAFANQANGGKATVMKLSGGIWTTVGSDGFSTGESRYLSLVFSPDGSPYVAFSDFASGQKATVMRFIGGAWTTVGSAGFSSGEADYTSLAFAPDGSPYLAYTDYGSSNWGATVMKYSNGIWNTVGGAGFTPGHARYTSLAFAQDGAPILAFSDFGTTPGGRCTVMVYRNSIWSFLGTRGISSDNTEFLSLAVAPDGTPTLAYRDYGTGFKATVMTYKNGLWSSVGNAGVSAGDVHNVSLAFAPDGTTYVAFTDGANGAKATVLKFSGGVWNIVGTSGFSAGQAPYTSLAFAPDGVPSLAYQDLSNSGKLTVMKLKQDTSLQLLSDHNTAFQGQPVTFTSTVQPSAASGTITIRDGAIDLGSVNLVGGSAAFTTSALSATIHAITAVYSGDDGYYGSTSYPLIQIVTPPYSLTVSITGNGSINSNPAGIACTSSPQSGTCTASFSAGPNVTLNATAGNSLFNGWGGNCAPCNQNISCPVSVNAITTCSASFSPSPLVILVGSPAAFSTMQSACDAAGNGAVIKAQVTTFSENLLLNIISRIVTIKGGYEPTFTTQSGITTIKGNLTIVKGGLIADRLSIR